MKDQASRIKFPVLRALHIDGYQLFPGTKNEAGIHHNFEPGITVVAGINGLGKTTILNIILRMLIGPVRPKKEGADAGRSSSLQIKRETSFNFFKKRVPDGAIDAVARAHITIDNHEIHIERSLSDLEILSLIIDDKEIKSPTHEIYEDYLTKLCGLTDYYDCYFLIKNMMFFLEDRTPLIWREEDQSEIFRILYYSPEESRALSELARNIKELDSRYRNLLWPYNKRVNELNELKQQEENKDENNSKL